MTSSILLLQEETSVWRTAERERRKLHTCHISSSIHATFTVTHTKGEESVRWGGGKAGVEHVRGGLLWDGKRRKMQWLGRVPVLLQHQLCFRFPDLLLRFLEKKRKKSLFILSQAVRNASFLTLKVFMCAYGEGRLMSAI